MSEHHDETVAPEPETAPTVTARTGARHPVSIGHLVMGVALLGLGVVWALIAGDVVEGSDIRFLLPAPWILAGVAGLVALVTADRRTLAAQRSATQEG
jgi:hypothetical protein